MDICKYESCTGCASCFNSCYHGAITMEPDTLGYLRPLINETKCVDCGLCQTVCPVNHEVSSHYPLSSYVATAKDKSEMFSSTSGGLASVIARVIIKSGGLVYGCEEKNCEEICHSRIEKEVDIDKLKGSKYVQSTIGDSFLKIKNDLKNKRKVLFIGTPCQVAGLRSYLRKKHDELYTIDLICHGVPSPKILRDAVKAYVPRESTNMCKVSFRQRDVKGKSHYGLFIDNQEGGRIFEEEFPKNTYIVGFLDALFYRESCYHCLYAKRERVSDITLGDYWDKEKKISIGLQGHGLSMLIVNTSKGMQILKAVKENVKLETSDYETFVSRNTSLKTPMPMHPLHHEFTRIYEEKGFLASAQKCLKDDIKRIKKEMFINNLSVIIYKIPGTKKLYKAIRGFVL